MKPTLDFGATPRILHLSRRADAVRAQLGGQRLTLAQAGPLRDDVSTDEITPVRILSHYDDSLARFPYTGFTTSEGERPIAAGAVQVLLQRNAARLGRSVNHRVVVTNFEAALRVVRAGLAISLVPREVAQAAADGLGLRLIPLAEPWAERRFILCYRDAQSLTPATQLLVEYLASLATP